MNDLHRLLRVLLYGAALTAIIPVFPFLHLWVQLFLGAGLAIGWLRKYLSGSQVRGWIGTLVTFVAVVWFVLQLSTTNVAEPLVQILSLLLAARLASDKTPRNILQIFVLSVILLAASSLLSLDMLYLIYLVLMIVILSGGLILLCFIRVDSETTLSRSEFKGLRLFLWCVPAGTLVLMMGLFFVLPRTPVPLWNVLGSESMALVGMTDQVQPGSISSLAASGEIAFRVETVELPVEQLYWRGIVLDQLDDQTWRRSSSKTGEVFRVEGAPAQEYLMVAEPKSDLFLVTLDRTDRLQGVAHRSETDGVFIRYRQDHKRMTYRGTIRPGAEAVFTGDPAPYLAVPASLSPQLVEIAALIAADAVGFEDRLSRLEVFFVQQQLSYSSRNLPQTPTPLATFLFDSRQGYCEHFASSFAVLLRLLDIPARLVGGYLGGTYNRLGNFYLVSEDRAHVWVEALNDDGVWKRLDPSRLAINADQALSLSFVSRSYVQNVMDALFHYWTRKVLNFDLQQQFQLFRQTTEVLVQLQDFELSTPTVGPLLLLFLVALLLFLLWRRRRAQGLVHAYLRQVARSAGMKKLPVALGLYHLGEAVDNPLCREFAELYGTAVYTDRPLSGADRQRLRQIIRQLKGQRLFIEVALPEALGDNRFSKADPVVDAIERE